MHPHAALITRFYTAFSQGNAAGMAACYHPDVRFSDPVFPSLKGAAASAMWAMLLARASDLVVSHSQVQANDETGRAHWDARYTFSKTGRKVLNRIDAQFRFQDGLIVEHIDQFSFPHWARQALGLPGWLLGHTSFLQGKVPGEAARGLASWLKQSG